MIIMSLSIVIAILLVTNYVLWKSGSIDDAEQPKSILDRPVLDKKERRAIMKRLRRWKEEGKLTRSEYESIYGLCKEEWDN